MYIIEFELGKLYVSISEHGIEKLLTSPIKDIYKRSDKTNAIFDELKKQLSEYFSGNRTKFNLPLNPQGTAFQVSVWNELLKIPFGKTITYKQQAIQMNHLKGIRAIASANGKNPISIIIPCHRVIGSNGELTGYAGGLKMKEWLLNLERGQQTLF